MRQKNEQLALLIRELKKLAIEQNVRLWKRVAEDLEKPTRQRRVVNVFKIDKFARPGEIVLVPGKVLGVGDLTHEVTVAALSFSEEARRKINSSGKALSIAELMKNNPKGEKVRIIG